MSDKQPKSAPSEVEVNTSGDYLGGWGQFGNSFVFWVSAVVLAACVGVLAFSISLLQG